MLTLRICHRLIGDPRLASNTPTAAPVRRTSESKAVTPRHGKYGFGESAGCSMALSLLPFAISIDLSSTESSASARKVASLLSTRLYGVLECAIAMSDEEPGYGRIMLVGRKEG
jgi:hypothetical protein